MELYMAPMEGITGYLYRNVYNKYFTGIDKYFTPFIAPAKGRPLRTRELKDILPENNENINVVPQILTNDAGDFIKTAKFLKEYGYTEVNINLGCPSGTVVSKCKGAGLLYDIERLDEFLYGVYEADIMAVSIKTRIGKLFPEEFEDIINVYKKYPIAELIIHPRVQTDYYKNTPNIFMFKRGVEQYLFNMQDDVKPVFSDGHEAAAHDVKEICYNGDVFSLADYRKIVAECPFISKVMLGRGVVGNPFLPEMIKSIAKEDGENRNRFNAFHNELLSAYQDSELGEHNTLFKMKELWLYMGGLFEACPNAHRYLKKIKKAKNMAEYKVTFNDLIVDNNISLNYNLCINGEDEDE